MAIATGTALAVAGIATTAVTAGASFAQAGKQKQAADQARRDADAAMAKARKELEVNYYAQQGIKKEPYELEREAMLAQGAQAIEAGVESERGAAAVAGKVQLAQQQGQGQIRTAMGQEMTALENKQLAEQSRLRDVGVQLDLEEVAGAQLAQANAERLRAQAQTQGWQGVASLGQQAAQLAPLFPTQPTAPAPVPLAENRVPSASAINPAKNIPADGNIFGNNPFGIQTQAPLLPYRPKGTPYPLSPNRPPSSTALPYATNYLDFTNIFGQ
jgi:hypothetical protein